MANWLTCFCIGPYVVSKEIRKSILNQTEILRAIPEGPAFVIHCSWILNISVSSFMLTLQLLLQLALRCINTLWFSLYSKTFLWLYFPNTNLYAQIRDFPRGEKRASESTPHTKTSRSKHKGAVHCCQLLLLNYSVYWEKEQDRTLSSLTVVLCCPLTCAPCSLIIELSNGEKWSIQLWPQVVVQITTKELCQDSSRALSLIQCSLKKIKLLLLLLSSSMFCDLSPLPIYFLPDETKCYVIDQNFQEN